MAKKFVLVSLQEKKAKKIAEVISNNTCRKILDYMATKKDVIESELSKELKIPISTVHYNMKALIEAKLVKSDEYHYSEKGKEVSHYRLANQYVIIAPEEDKKDLRKKLKSLLPITLVAGATASIIRMFSGYYYGASAKMADFVPALASRAMPEAVAGGANTAADVAKGAAAPMLYEVAEESADKVVVEVSRKAVDDAVVESAPHVAQKVAEPMAQVVPATPPSAPMPEPAQVLDHASKSGLWDWIVSHPLDLLLWFLVGAAIGVGLWFLIRYIRRRKLTKKIEVR